MESAAAVAAGMVPTALGGDDGQRFEPAAQTRPERLRIAVARDFPPGTRGRLSDDVSGALDETAGQLRSLGHTVVDGKVDLRARDVPVIVGLILRGVRDLVAPAVRPQRLERRTRAFARPGALVSDRTTERLLDAERAMAARLTATFDDHDALLTPVMSAPAVPAGIMEGRGATVTYLWETGWVPFTIRWNITGQPAASVPAGLPGRPHARRADRRPTARGANGSRAGRRAGSGALVDRSSAGRGLSPARPCRSGYYMLWPVRPRSSRR
jgi:amidase